MQVNTTLSFISLYLSVLTLTKSSLTLNANRISCRPGSYIILSLPNPQWILAGF